MTEEIRELQKRVDATPTNFALQLQLVKAIKAYGVALDKEQDEILRKAFQ